MSGVTAAIRYARALYEVASDRGLLAETLDDVGAIACILDAAPEIRQFCLEREHPPGDEMQFVEIAFSPYVHELTQHTLQILAENGRLGVIPHLPAAFGQIHDDATAVVRITLETAAPADDGLRQEVTERMRRRLGQEIQLETHTNPRLIGGFRILWKGRLLDHSAAGRVRAMRRTFTPRPLAT